MRGIRGEPVGVWLRHGRPARFVWRGRMYTVMYVLDRTDAVEPEASGRECWRVEATPERTVPPTRYELCHDLAADSWLLTRG
jgi:hypothetical protein